MQFFKDAFTFEKSQENQPNSVSGAHFNRYFTSVYHLLTFGPYTDTKPRRYASFKSYGTSYCLYTAPCKCTLYCIDCIFVYTSTLSKSGGDADTESKLKLQLGARVQDETACVVGEHRFCKQCIYTHRKLHEALQVETLC